ncbi:hypothetical protein [Chitinimonas sp. JJ19]|uniref:hypothetical protein n=1 Tax=Chitinimonas sp. JJ19 TaxID=3109352 RepID=UPI003002C459
MEMSNRDVLAETLAHLEEVSIQILRHTMEITIEQYRSEVLFTWENQQPDAPARFLKECEKTIAMSREEADPFKAEQLKDNALRLEFQRSQAFLVSAMQHIADDKEMYAWPSLVEAAFILGKISVTGAVYRMYHSTLKDEKIRKAKAGGEANGARSQPVREELWRRVKQECENGSKWPSIKNALELLQDDIIEFSRGTERVLSKYQFQKTARGWIKQMPEYEKYFATKSGA